MDDFSILKMLDVPISISRTRIRLKDRRTDLVTETIFYHPGEAYPVWKMREIDRLGYEIVSCKTESTATGTIPWGTLSGFIQKMELCDDRPEQKRECPE